MWNKDKDSQRRTYGVNKASDIPSVLRNPLESASRDTEKIEGWFRFQQLVYQDRNSQPTASQSSVSTPVAERGKTESIRANNPPLSPISLNQLKGITPRKGPGSSLPTQSLQYNCSVDDQDTFDKLFLPPSSKSKKKLKIIMNQDILTK